MYFFQKQKVNYLYNRVKCEYSFQPLHRSHFQLLLSWLQTLHVKKWYDADINHSIETVKEKYTSYTNGYKEINGIKKPIAAYLCMIDDAPIGYIQLYNPRDFESEIKFTDLPLSLGALDLFIGAPEYVGKGIGSKIIKIFLKKYAQKYEYIFVNPDVKNSAAIKCYEKVGFKIISQKQNPNELWMLFDNRAV